MPHRDDFEAALARISALEHELEHAREEADEALRAENARLKARIAELELRLAPPTTDLASTYEEEDRRERELIAVLTELKGRARESAFLIEELERVATGEPLPAIVAIARRFVEGSATLEELTDAEDRAAMQVTATGEALENSDASQGPTHEHAVEAHRIAELVWTLVAALEPEFTDEFRELVARKLAPDPDSVVRARRY